MNLEKGGKHPSNRLVHFEPPFQSQLKPLPSIWDREKSRIIRNNFIQKNIQKVRSPKSPQSSRRRCCSADNPSRRCSNRTRNRSNNHQKCAKDNSDSRRTVIIEQHYQKPSSIYRLNSIVFLNSLRNHCPGNDNRMSKQQDNSALVGDSFVKLKTAEFESMTNGHDLKKSPMNDSISAMTGTTAATAATATTTVNNNNNNNSDVHENGVKEPLYKKNSSSSGMNGHSSSGLMGARRGSSRSRPKSSYGRQNRLLNSAQTSKSTPKLNRLESDTAFDDDNGNKSENDLDNEDVDNEVFVYDREPGNDDDDDDDDFVPLFHRSLDKISSIANWEKQIRYELEIEKELQRRELDRQKEKLQSDQRKLEDWDKQLRIELDARERKIRLTEDEFKSRLDEHEQRSKDLMRKEQMINEIVAERIKNEMKLEIEKLRKKFNELEVQKLNLSKRECRVREVEAQLHEQVKVVKEKIDGKRLSEMELAKYKKETEILKKENEVLKERVDTMDDYQVNKFENRALKNELQILKDSLDSKSSELERERDRWEKEQRATDQKIMGLRNDLRQAEQELVIYKQKAQGDLDEMTSKYEATNGQFKRLQIFVKDLLAKINSGSPGSIGGHYHQKSMPTNMQYTKMSPNSGYYHPHPHHHHHHHRRHNSLSGTGHGVRPAARSTSGLMGLHAGSSAMHPERRTGTSTAAIHQRSVSMDDHDLMTVRRRTVPLNSTRTLKGCNLCEDDDEYLNDHQLSRSNDYLEFAGSSSEQFYNNQQEFIEQRAIDDIFEEEPTSKQHEYYCNEDNGNAEDVYAEEHEHDEHHQHTQQQQQHHHRSHDDSRQYGHESQGADTQKTDEVVDKIVNRIYEKINNHSAGSTPTKETTNRGIHGTRPDFLNNDSLFISKLIASMAIENAHNNEQSVINQQPQQNIESHVNSSQQIDHGSIPTTGDIINHNQHYQQQHQQALFNSPTQRIVQPTSLYEELLPFTVQNIQNIPITGTTAIPQNDNNNNSLLVSSQQKSPQTKVNNSTTVSAPNVSTPISVSGNVTANTGVLESNSADNTGNQPINNPSQPISTPVSGQSQVAGVSMINLSSSNVSIVGAVHSKHSNDMQNKISDESSKSESFEVDW